MTCNTYHSGFSHSFSISTVSSFAFSITLCPWSLQSSGVLIFSSCSTFLDSVIIPFLSCWQTIFVAKLLLYYHFHSHLYYHLHHVFKAHTISEPACRIQKKYNCYNVTIASSVSHTSCSFNLLPFLSTTFLIFLVRSTYSCVTIRSSSSSLFKLLFITNPMICCP